MKRAVVLGCLFARAAAADPPITNRDYAIDLYSGVALGDTAMVGMGGTGAAVVVGTAGVLVNPSAIGVRATTDRDAWSWDYHLDYLTGKYSSDYDNNGAANDHTGASLLTGGIGVRLHDWAVAATMVGQYTPLPNTTLRAEALRVRVVVARWIPSLDLAIGIGAQTGTFQLEESGAPALFSLTAVAGIAGATWLPRDTDFRVGLALEAPVDGGEVKADGCDPMDCRGYILPDRVHVPWRAVAGGAYRLGPTAWNQLVPGHFRDEAAWTFAADVVLTGGAANGYGIEAFGMQELQRSGRHVALSVRGGAEYEWLPGRLRVRGGTYWEPGRFDEVGGRLHGTFGADVRVFAFDLWGPRRGRLSATADLASRYRNIAVSVGFWH